MKHKSIIFALCTVALIATGCSGQVNNDPNAIHVSCVQLGYGTEWLTTLMKEYTNKTGVKFAYTEVVGQAGNNNLNDNLRSLSGNTDLYGLRPGSFHELIYRGKITTGGVTYDHAFEPLTDIFNEEYEGESGNNTISKKLDPIFKDYVTVGEEAYGLPWANGFQSFVRNLDVWTKCGYTAAQYPRTTDELFEMMDNINNVIATTSDSKLKGAAPMIYCSQDEYYTSIIGSWFAQYEGSQEMEKFYAGRNPDGKRGPDMFTFDGVTEALKVAGRIVEYNKSTGKYKYQHVNSKKLSFTQMQNYFLAGDAAFCVNGTWLEVENPKARTSNIDYIKIPLVSSIVNNGKLHKTYTESQLRELVTFLDAHIEPGDNAGLPSEFDVEDVEFIRNSRNTGYYMRTDYDHLFVVPSWSNKKEQTKKFLKWMYSDEALQIFYDKMNGHHLPATPSTGSYDTSHVQLSQFRISCNKAFEEGKFCQYMSATVKDKIFSVAKVQSNMSNTISKTGNCIDWLVDGMTPDQIVIENTNYLTTRWASILNSLDKED